MARKQKKYFLASIMLGLMLAWGAVPTPAMLTKAQAPVVRALLFYSPSCPHCHEVIENVIPPLVDRYGEQLNIFGINVSLEEGQNLYRAAIQRFNIPENRLGVPTVIIGAEILVGSVEIPSRLPELIEKHLTSGGVDWPDIPGLDTVLSSEDLAQDSETASGWQANFLRDPLANTFSILMLLAMLTAVFRSVVLFRRRGRRNPGELPTWLVPALAMVGLGVATYLAFIETTNTAAVCGPVGDCNAVQQSPYAALFGILPIGILGMIGYVGIAAAWLFAKYGPPEWHAHASISIWALAAGGTLFSIYLTFLEPFVIGATCMWCLTSALVMTTLFWVTTPKAVYEWRTLRKTDRKTNRQRTRPA